MSCLRKGFKANNDREASRYPGVYMDVCVICLRYSTACDGNVIMAGAFLRGYDTIIVSKTSVMKAQRTIIASVHVVFSFPFPLLLLLFFLLKGPYL